MNKKQFRSIKYKFLLSTMTLVFIFTSLTMYLWYTTTYKNAEEMSLTHVNEMINVSTNNFEIVLEDINSIISSVVTNKGNIVSVYSKELSDYNSDKELLDDNRKVENYLHGLYSYKKYIKGLMVTGLDGRSFVNGFMPSLEQLKEQTWYNELLNKEGKTVLIPPHSISPTDGDRENDYTDRTISVCKPILDISNNYVLGFAIADIRCEILQDIFNIDLENYGSVLIIDKKTGEFIYKPEPSKLPSTFSDNEIKRIFNNIDSDKGHMYTKVSDKDVLVIYSTSLFTGWTTVALIPKDMLLSDFYKTRNANIIISALFCIIATIMTFMIMSILTRNILKLNKAIKNIDRDSLNISIIITTNDEIGQLYQQFNNMVARIKNLIDDIKKAEKDKRKLEIKALQSQINPHFLYNTLNTINFLAEIQGAKNIKKVSESLSVLLHINMQDRSFISVGEEIQYIKSYLTIQSYKYSNKFIADFTIEDGVIDCMILKLLLQPIVENAIVHGIAPMQTRGIITIKIFKDENCLKIRIRDNGVGISENKIEELMHTEVDSDSIGIRNVISRIKLHFGEEYGVSIISEPDIFTVVEVTIPVIHSGEVEKFA